MSIANEKQATDEDDPSIKAMAKSVFSSLQHGVERIQKLFFNGDCKNGSAEQAYEELQILIMDEYWKMQDFQHNEKITNRLNTTRGRGRGGKNVTSTKTVTNPSTNHSSQ